MKLLVLLFALTFAGYVDAVVSGKCGGNDVISTGLSEVSNGDCVDVQSRLQQQQPQQNMGRYGQSGGQQRMFGQSGGQQQPQQNMGRYGQSGGQ